MLFGILHLLLQDYIEWILKSKHVGKQKLDQIILKVVHYCRLDLDQLYILLTALTRFIKLKHVENYTFLSWIYIWHEAMTNRSWTFAVWYLACTFTGLYWANIKLKTCWKTKVGPSHLESGTLFVDWILINCIFFWQPWQCL